MFSATAAREFVKLPLLVLHYYEHQQEEKDNGVLSFLVLHYFIEDGTDKDAADDSKLPFKSAENINPVSSIVLPSLPVAGKNLIPAVISNTKFFPHNDAFIASQYLASIWQPPRHC
jgi:hypothetical protein